MTGRDQWPPSSSSTVSSWTGLASGRPCVGADGLRLRLRSLFAGGGAGPAWILFPRGGESLPQGQASQLLPLLLWDLRRPLPRETEV